VRLLDTRIDKMIKDASASQGTLLDIFERIENVFRRLETYVDLPLTKEMTDIVVKVMAEVLRVLALVTKDFKQGTLSKSIIVDGMSPSRIVSSIEKFLKKVTGRSDIEDALRRLDKLTQEEHRMTTAQNLRVTHGISDKVDLVIDGGHIVYPMSSRPYSSNQFSARCRQPETFVA
jgi:hypothetical protein